MVRFVILITLSLLLVANKSAAEDCIIDVVSDNPNSSPLVFALGEVFIDPMEENTRNILIKEGEEFWIACPGGVFYQQNDFFSDGERAKCLGNITISVQGKPFQFNDIKCFLNPVDRPYLLASETNKYCESDGDIITIGYGYGSDIDGGLLPVYQACVNRKNSVTLYVKYILTEWADALINHTPCPDTVGLDSEVPPFYDEDYIDELLSDLGYNGSIYLIEGHLAANDDFFYPFQRDATHCYTNIAPQWNTIEAGNWKVLEQSVRKLVTDGYHEDLITYAGALDVASLEDLKNGGILYLYLSNPKVPVPRWFWKLIYSPKASQGNFLLIYNNPFITQKEEVDSEFFGTICIQDEMENIDWLPNINNNNSQSGFTYACLLHNIKDITLYEVMLNLLTSVKRNPSNFFAPSINIPT